MKLRRTTFIALIAAALLGAPAMVREQPHRSVAPQRIRAGSSCRMRWHPAGSACLRTPMSAQSRPRCNCSLPWCGGRPLRACLYRHLAQDLRDGIRSIARNVVARRDDSTGATLVVSELKAHQLGGKSAGTSTSRNAAAAAISHSTAAPRPKRFVRGDRSGRDADKFLRGLHHRQPGDRQAVDAAGPRSRTSATPSAICPPPTRTVTTPATTAQRGAWIRDTWLGLAGGRSDVTANCSPPAATAATSPR